MEMQFTKDEMTKLTMEGVDEVFKGEDDIPPELRILVTRGFLAGLSAGFKIGMREQQTISNAVLDAVVEAVNAIGNGEEKTSE